MRDEDDGGTWGEENELGWGELWWFCGVQHGGAVPGGYGEVGAVLHWRMLGGEGYGEEFVCGFRFGGSCQHSDASDAREAPGTDEAFLCQAS